MKTTYTVRREDINGKEVESMNFTHLNQKLIQSAFDEMVLRAKDGDFIEYTKSEPHKKHINPNILYVEIVRGRPYTFTNTGKLKEYTITQRV